MTDCIFCKIINKEVPSEKPIYEDDKLIVISDIKPKAPFHLLVIPKKHIISIGYLEEEDKGLMGEMLLLAKKTC